jgi:putative endonuclease
MAFMYVLQCADGTYYVGSTRDLARRLQQHRDGLGSHYTRRRRPVRLVYFELHEDIGVAYGRERTVHGWTRSRKRRLIDGGPGKRVSDDGVTLGFLA